MKPIKLIVGLGNPGAEYAQTRHNAGFWLLDELAWRYQIAFANEKKFFGQVGRGKIGTQDVRLLKPETFMNRSGQSVAALALFYQIQPEEILVVHDELDLPCGSVKLKQGGGNGGHNGLKDIQQRLGSGQFWRLRLGIGHPGDKNAVVAYVLKKPRAEEYTHIDEAMIHALPLMQDIVQAHNIQAVIQTLHSRPKRL